MGPDTAPGYKKPRSEGKQKQPRLRNIGQNPYYIYINPLVTPTNLEYSNYCTRAQSYYKLVSDQVVLNCSYNFRPDP